MPCSVFIGGANAGKAGRVLQAARRSLQRGETPILVVPTLGDVRRLEAELAEKWPLGIRVAKFEALLEEFWQLHGDGRRFIDRYTREELLTLATSNRAALSGEGAKGAVKLAAQLARLAGNLTLRAGSGSWGTDLCQVLEEYRRDLPARGLIEPNEALKELGQASFDIGGVLGVLHFDALEPVRAAFLLEVGSRNEVVVALTWEDGRGATRANRETVSWLADHGASVEAVEEGERTGLAAFAASLGGPAVDIHADADVEFWAASGPESECALVAEAASLAASDGTAAERICVVFPDLDARRDALAAAFRASGVDADTRAGAKLSTTAFGRALQAAVELATGRAGRAQAVGLATGPFGGIGGPEAWALDKRWRGARVEDSRQLLRDLADLASPEARSALAAASSVARGGEVVEWKILSARMAAVVLSHGCDGTLERETAGGVSAVDALLDTIAISEVAGGLETHRVLELLGEARLPGAAEERVGEVQVCTIGEIGARRFDVLIVGGLNENEFSAPSGRPFAEAIDLVGDMPCDSDPLDLLRLQFYGLVTRARKKLVLVRQETDAAGRAQRASLAWSDAVDAFRPARGDFDDEFERKLVSRRHGQTDLVRVAPVFTAGRQELRASAAMTAYARPERACLEDGHVGDRPLAATEIEAYLQCPYRWFYERVVRPEEVDREVDARELGTYVHALLARTYGTLSAQGVARVTPENLADALAVLGSEIVKARRRVPLNGSVGEELAMARAERWARDVIGQDVEFLPAFAPTAVELGFGGDEHPFEFAGVRMRGRIDRVDTAETVAFVTDYKSSRAVTPLSKFEQEGRVQAVVYAAAAEEVLGVRVVGSAYRSLSSGKLGGYWRRDLLGGVPTGLCADEVLGADEYARLVERTQDRVAEAAAGMRSGRIPREPQVKGACRYCAIKSVCEGAVL